MAVASTKAEIRDDGKQYAAFEGFAASGDAGTQVHLPKGVTAVTFQAVGTFAGGLSIQIQGSNDGGVTWTDTGMTPLTAVAIRALTVFPDLVRLAATAGGGGADVDVHMIAYFSP